MRKKKVSSFKNDECFRDSKGFSWRMKGKEGMTCAQSLQTSYPGPFDDGELVTPISNEEL